MLLIILAIFVPVINLEGSPLKNIPVTLKQPNGEIIHCFNSGNEYYNWLHDKDAYKIIQHPVTGYYTYAVQSGGNIVASGFIVGEADPTKAGLPKTIKLSEERRLEASAQFLAGSPLNASQILSAPKAGIINNLVVFIRFSDDSEFTQDISDYAIMFNGSSTRDNSMINYFEEVSYI